MLSVSNWCVGDLLGPVSFEVAPGQRLGIIGESGSGKSLTALSIMQLLPEDLPTRGSITRGDAKIAMVFQEPMSALDPLMRIRKQLRYAGADPAEALASVDLDPALAARYPHELSGGQRQRVLIAMAMAQQPDLLICDEPTTALDASTQDGILDLLEELVTARGTALLFITHDLRVLRRMCPEAIVMRDGQIVESGDVLTHPTQDYTKQLIAASEPKPPGPAPQLGEPIITLEHVSKHYGKAIALNDVTLSVRQGERLGVVGGSGSGKTTLLKLISGLSQPSSGRVDVAKRVQMVFQDPQGSLNPRLPIWRSVAEGKKGASRAEVAAILEEVGISGSLERYPHEFSGGQRQRISIARALIGKPDILLADEAVSALDVSVRAQILDLLERLVNAHGLTLVFISHDLRVVRQICSSVAVIYRGSIVESGDIWENPQHEYTKKLIAAAR
ncbi:ABC transporter ATP-binding protein [Corynebacterium sp.]|uniref:ATP-binding cassette domain-containing protein n=1 Tax=Corynebacterium sp. TaxID=1720 RepID=UPI0026DB1C16|nr:ABC transporter ATP-binding protein [Corynebacterium sp.]MDO5031063.1 ABC transporter ATP-binding protein [Corynebacterium sp.]